MSFWCYGEKPKAKEDAVESSSFVVLQEQKNRVKPEQMGFSLSLTLKTLNPKIFIIFTSLP